MPLRKKKLGGKKKGAKGAKGGKAKKASKSKSVRMAKDSVACMAFNKDNTQIALGVGKEVWIFTNGSNDEPLTTLARSKWVKAHVLAAHDLEVSGVDWCPTSDKIITCSHDRNAFVWTKKTTGEWVQGLVILRITRAAIAAKWSPKGNKFAVTSGAKRVPICRFEKTDDWWIPEMISKHKSSVVAVDWHPNNTVIATGSTDFRCRVISAYLERVDGEDSDHAPFEDGDFGTVLAEFECKGWVMDVAFSPEGDKLTFIGHDSSITIVDCGSLDQHTKKTNVLPFSAILFIDETNIIAGGYNFVPYKVSAADGVPVLGDSIDKGKTEKKATKTQSDSQKAMSMFVNQDKLGTKSAVASLDSKHQAAITCMRKCSKTHFATAGEDGRVVFWPL